MLPLDTEFDAAMSAFEAAGGLDPSGLRSVATLDQRLEMTQRLARACDAMAAWQRALPGEFDRRLMAAGIGAEARQGYLRGMRRNHPLQQRAVDSALEFAKSALAELEVLRDGHAAWSLSDDGTVVFEGDTLGTRYRAAQERTQAAGEAYGRAAELVVRRMREMGTSRR